MISCLIWIVMVCLSLTLRDLIIRFLFVLISHCRNEVRQLELQVFFQFYSIQKI